ncbi:hypothetical protein PM082_008784 [Marasmius tenuissimus]|nr:hypothetical protein PM082_008784 [Marasmius tenuissimus]
MCRGSRPKDDHSAMPRTNINRGRDQILGDIVEVNNVGGDQVQQNFVTNLFSPRTTRLQDRLAGVGASHLSQKQYDRGLECLEGTRVELIRAILDWLASKDWSSPVCWLSGATGVGKSSIAMTIAKSCEGKGLASSFFFFRPDPKRNNPSAFVLSIAHGLVERMPFARGYINKRIARYPTILEASMEDQFRELVFKPCVRWRQLRRLVSKLPLAPKEPSLVIIDGLDECSDEDTQRHILSTILYSYKQSRHFPLRFLICSRPEKWIREAFDEEDFRRLTQHFRLDDEVFPNRDIERYYLREFKRIRESPQFARLPFPRVWPSPEDLERLVDKSSGQFVYAATMIKVVSSRGSNPITQLRNMLDHDPPSGSFAAVDYLYQVVLSDHPNPDQLVLVLAAIFILPPHAPPSSEFIELLLGLPIGEVDIILRPMHSVLNIRDADVPIAAYHASFMDFLFDESRSERFYIGASARREVLARRWIQALKPTNQSSSSDSAATCTLWDGWVEFCRNIERPSQKLLSDLRKTDLLTICVNVALIHRNCRELSSIVTRPLEAIISWLATMDDSPPVETIQYFQEFLEQLKPDGRPLTAIDSLYQMILSNHPNPEQLAHVLAAIFILPPHGPSSPEFIELLLGLPSGEVDVILRPMHSVLTIRGADIPIVAFHASFTDFLFDESRSERFYIGASAWREFLARRWIQALKPTNQPLSFDDQIKRTLWDRWTGFCLCVERPSKKLLSDLQKIDLLVISVNVALIHRKCKELSSVVTRPLEAVISWLAPMDGSLLVKTINHFQEFLEQFQHTLMVESDERESFLTRVAVIPVTRLPSNINSGPGQSRGSPYRELYTLYRLLLTAHPNRKKLRPILAAILVLRPHLKPSPEWIGLLFNMPPGDVVLLLQGMRPVLDVRGWGTEIRIRHPSFSEYLVDQGTSRDLHIDIPAQRDVIVRRWLHAVSAVKMQTYSSDQLYGDSTNSFFTEWMGFCTRSTEPASNLIHRLRDIDFASVYFCTHFPTLTGRYYVSSWYTTFGDLRDWMAKFVRGLGFGNSLAQGVMDKLRILPKSFHLEQLAGPLLDADLVVAVLIATQCLAYDGTLTSATKENLRKYQRQAPLRITECHCNDHCQPTENESGDLAKHLAYQEACTRVLRAQVTEFELLAKSTRQAELVTIFHYVVGSSLLQHCRLDIELFSLCIKLFESARVLPPEMQIPRGKKDRLCGWIEVCTAFLNQLPHIVD